MYAWSRLDVPVACEGKRHAPGRTKNTSKRGASLGEWVAGRQARAVSSIKNSDFSLIFRVLHPFVCRCGSSVTASVTRARFIDPGGTTPPKKPGEPRQPAKTGATNRTARSEGQKVTRPQSDKVTRSNEADAGSRRQSEAVGGNRRHPKKAEESRRRPKKAEGKPGRTAANENKGVEIMNQSAHHGHCGICGSDAIETD